jgi:hypothetical protein
MFKIKVALAAVALIAVGAAFCGPAQARKAWFGPGSGPISPYANYKGFAQVPRQAGGAGMFGGHRATTQPYSGAYRCVPNVGLVGANGICPD